MPLAHSLVQERLDVPEPEPPRLEPVLLEQVRLCHFKAKGCGRCGLARTNRAHTSGACEFQRRNGCARCGGNKGDPVHFGQPPSYNAMASGVGASSPMIYATMKAKWQEIFDGLLRASGLPRGLARVFAEGEVTFPDQREDRDQGNFRVVIEKALGDALEAGGWLPRDDWSHYEFGGLTQRYQRGESATRVYLFPTAAAPALPDANSGAIVGGVPDE
jgi:hypothetical protein